MRTQGPRQIEVTSLAKGKFTLRLVEAGKAYVTPKHEVTWRELQQPHRGSLTAGEVRIHSYPGDFTFVELRGEHWLRIDKKDWVDFYDACMAGNERKFGKLTLSQAATPD